MSESRHGRLARVLTEAVVIIFSILVALGLDAWWQGTQERGRERVILERILEELDGIAADDQEKILFRNAAGLNERRPL